MTPLVGIEHVRALLSTPGVCGFDFETTIAKAYQREVCTLQAAHEDGRVAVAHVWPNGAEATREAFRGCKATVVAHRAIFETECLVKSGVHVPVECTLIAAKCLRGVMEGDKAHRTKWDLASVAKRELGREDIDKSIRDRDWREPLDDEALGYIIDDAEIARDLWLKFMGLWDDQSWAGYKVIRDSLPATAESNLHGLPFNRDAHLVLQQNLLMEMAGLETELDLLCYGGIEKPGSTKQVAEWIINVMMNGFEEEQKRPEVFAVLFHQATGKSWPLTNTGQLGLGKKVLEYRLHELHKVAPIVANYLVKRLEWSKVAKLYQAFGPALMKHVGEDGYLRGSFNPHGAQTSRESCTDPNLQQMPNDPIFRALFEALRDVVIRHAIPRPELTYPRKLIICDYGQVELRVGCLIAGDTAMQAVFAAGEDIHQASATKIKRILSGDPNAVATPAERKKSKAPTFASLYGAQATAIALSSGLSYEEACELLDAWLSAYPGIKKYRDTAFEKAQADGGVRLVSGQWIGMASDTRPAQAINCPVQGSSASVLYLAKKMVHDAVVGARALGADIWFAASIHDEIILDAAEKDAALAKDLLEKNMVGALLHYFPEAAKLNMANLADAAVVDSWAEKP